MFISYQRGRRIVVATPAFDQAANSIAKSSGSSGTNAPISGNNIGAIQG